MKPLRLEDLTVEQKIGQLIVARRTTNQADFDYALGLIRDHALGGAQALPKEGARQNVIDPVLQAADYPVFVAADMERGFQLGDLQIAGNVALGALDDPQATYDFAKVTAMQAKQMGYNMIWSPDIDVAEHECILRPLRVMGGIKELVAKHGIAYMRAFADCGIVGTAKHFPSVFDRMEDSHMFEPESYHTKEELMNECLYPYRQILKALGSDMLGVMTSHDKLVNIDPNNPVTVSPKGVALLREIGFDGLAITDSLAMMGIVQKYGDEAIPGLAIAAGHDMILPNYRIPLKDTYNYLLNAYRNGVFDEQRLNEACARVLRAQAFTMKQPAQKQITEQDRATIQRINRDCICAVTDRGLTPAIDRGKRHLFIILKNNIYEEGEAKDNYEIGFAKVWDPQKMAERFKTLFPNSDVEYICEFPHRDQIERACAAAVSHDDVVFVTFCEPNAYQGSDGLTERVRYLIRSMAYNIAAVVHVGNPYAMQKIVHVPRLIFGFPHITCMDALPLVLAGELEARGRMPFNLKLN